MFFCHLQVEYFVYLINSKQPLSHRSYTRTLKNNSSKRLEMILTGREKKNLFGLWRRGAGAIMLTMGMAPK